MQTHEHIGYNVAALGGGTGLSNLGAALRPHIIEGIKNPEEALNLELIVAMSDNGGASKIQMQRGEIAMPPGDGRKCLSSVSKYALVREAWEYRHEDGPYAGYPEGNIRIAESTRRLGCIAKAFAYEGQTIGAVARVIPATVMPHSLVLEDGGRIVIGEEEISESTLLTPNDFMVSHRPPVQAYQGAIDAIHRAHLKVLAAGSLPESILAVAAIPDIAQAIRDSDAPLAMFTNATNERRHTPGWHVMEHVRAIEKHIGRPVDTVIYNNAALPQEVTNKTDLTEADRVNHDPEQFKNQMIRHIGAPLVQQRVTPIYSKGRGTKEKIELVHDPELSAQIVINLVKEAVQVKRQTTELAA